MNVLLLQLDLAWHNPAANYAKLRDMLSQANPAAGTLVATPEMFANGFSMAVDEVAEPDDGPTLRLARELARQYQITLVLGRVTKPDDRGRNEAVVAGPDGTILTRYHKLHPFRFAGETNHYRGGEGVAVFDWGGTRVAPLICYDLRFPEAFRNATRRGAEVLLVIANWPTARVKHWLALLTARAIENQAYVIGVNRSGNDPNVAYPGRSVAIDPRGEIIADAGEIEAALAATLDLDALRAYRTQFPALADMRDDLFPTPHSSAKQRPQK